MESKKQKSVWAVWLMILITMFIFPLQLFVNFNLPFTQIIYALMMVVGSYVGIDQISSFKKTQNKMPEGIKYTGSYKKLLRIVIAMFFITIEILVMQGFIPEIQLPIGEMIMCLGIVTSAFVGGNKANNIAINSKKEVSKK